MYCPSCNKAFPDHFTFCDSCGGKLISETPVAVPQQPASQPVYQQNSGYQNPNYQSTGYQNQGYQAPNQGYAPPPPSYPSYAAPQDNQVVSTGTWLGIFLINLIPGIGTLIYLILLFVWAFGNPRKKSLKNFAKASLILMLIGIIVSVLVAIFLWPMINDMLYEYAGWDFYELFNFDF